MNFLYQSVVVAVATITCFSDAAVVTGQESWPLSGNGAWRRAQAEREFYHALSAGYRVSTEYKRNAVGSLQRLARETREQARLARPGNVVDRAPRAISPQTSWS
jgi:hypothetical protein